MMRAVELFAVKLEMITLNNVPAGQTGNENPLATFTTSKKGVVKVAKGILLSRIRRKKHITERRVSCERAESIIESKKQSEKAKRRRITKKMNTNSKVLKCILQCLKNGVNQEVLFWNDKGKGIFVLKFWHQNNPHWNENVLNLFKDVEKAISIARFENYIKSPNYAEKCKTRFRANLKKLIKARALIFIKEETMKDNSKERRYQITSYSEEFLSDSSKGSEVGEVIENICEMDDNEREEKFKVETQVLPSRSGDTSRYDFAFPPEDRIFTMAGNPIQMETDSEHLEEVTLNTLNTEIYSAPDNWQLENIFVRTVSVPNSNIIAIPQNNIVQTVSAHNSAVMQSTPLCCNLQSCDFQGNDIYELYRFENATMYSPGKNVRVLPSWLKFAVLVLLEFITPSQNFKAVFQAFPSI